MDVEKILAKLKAAQGDGPATSTKLSRSAGKDDPKCSLTELEQSNFLLAAAANHANPTKFKPLDFVRYRKEVQSFIRNSSALHVVVEVFAEKRKIPFTSDSEGSHLSYREYDMLIAVCDPFHDGGILKYMADSRDMEMYPGGERLKGDGTA